MHNTVVYFTIIGETENSNDVLSLGLDANSAREMIEAIKECIETDVDGDKNYYIATKGLLVSQKNI